MYPQNIMIRVYDAFSQQINSMCGPVYDYSFEDFLNDASPEEWAEWEQKAAELELPVDYYVREFVACAG